MLLIELFIMLMEFNTLIFVGGVLVAKKTSGRKGSYQGQSSRVTWAQAFRDVSIRLIDVFYKLCDGGNLLGGIILLVFVLLYYTIYKISPDQANEHLLWIRSFFYSERYYFFPLFGLVCFTLFAIKKLSRINKKEIKRVSKLRKDIMHGKKSGELKELEDHSTSHFDIEGED